MVVLLEELPLEHLSALVPVDRHERGAVGEVPEDRVRLGEGATVVEHERRHAERRVQPAEDVGAVGAIGDGELVAVEREPELGEEQAHLVAVARDRRVVEQHLSALWPCGERRRSTQASRSRSPPSTASLISRCRSVDGLAHVAHPATERAGDRRRLGRADDEQHDADEDDDLPDPDPEWHDVMVRGGARARRSRWLSAPSAPTAGRPASGRRGLGCAVAHRELVAAFGRHGRVGRSFARRRACARHGARASVPASPSRHARAPSSLASSVAWIPSSSTPLVRSGQRRPCVSPGDCSGAPIAS